MKDIASFLFCFQNDDVTCPETTVAMETTAAMAASGYNMSLYADLTTSSGNELNKYKKRKLVEVLFKQDIFL